MTLFPTLIGEAFAHLPAAVRRLHSPVGPLRTTGRADITAPDHIAARLLCLLAGLPRPGRDVVVEVTFLPQPGGELWRRRFASRRYASRMTAGQGADSGRLIEHFGPLFDLVFRLESGADGLRWSMERWKLLGVPLPTWTTPRIDAIEAADGDRFTFDIRVAFPLIGPVVAYRGWLEPQK